MSRQKESYLIVLQQKRYAKNVRLWLSVTPTPAPSGSYLLSQPFTGSLWLLLDLSLSLSFSLWLSVTPTLALTCSHCHSLAYSGPLWLTIAFWFRIYSPWSALRALARLSAPLPRWRTFFLSDQTECKWKVQTTINGKDQRAPPDSQLHLVTKLCL